MLICMCCRQCIFFASFSVLMKFSRVVSWSLPIFDEIQNPCFWFNILIFMMNRRCSSFTANRCQICSYKCIDAGIRRCFYALASLPDNHFTSKEAVLPMVPKFIEIFGQGATLWDCCSGEDTPLAAWFRIYFTWKWFIRWRTGLYYHGEARRCDGNRLEFSILQSK